MRHALRCAFAGAIGPQIYVCMEASVNEGHACGEGLQTFEVHAITQHCLVHLSG